MGEQEEVDFTKLSLDDRVVHKNWKARVSAYEELVQIFNQIDDEKSSEWSKWESVVRNFPTDSNAAAQEKGLEALVVYMENCATHGPQMVGDVVSNIIAKCLASSRARTRELAVSIVLKCVEIEKYETVQEELMKGMDGKNPKQVTACVSILTQSLREFGDKVLNIKALLKKIPILLEDRDKTVRDETKKLVVEIFKWIGPTFKSQLTSLKPFLLTELETEFEKVSNENPHAIRYLKSHQNKMKQEIENIDILEEGDDDDVPDQIGAKAETLDFIEPEDILSKLPKDFYDKCEFKKWQDRKDSLEALDALVTKYAKLENGDYGDLVGMLQRIIGKDSNVVVVALAVKCVTGLANGLEKNFASYAASSIQTILEKFKEKKPTVLTALKDASDACFFSTNLEQIQEDAIQALKSKNPSVKTESALFLGRCFSKVPKTIMTDKKFMKPYITALLVNINDSDVGVRDAAAEAIGVCLKSTGEKYMSSFLGDLDALKMQKIKEVADKAVIAAPKEKTETKPAPVKDGSTKKSTPTKTADSASRAVKTPISNAGNFVKRDVGSNPNIPIIDDESSGPNSAPGPTETAKAVGSPDERVDILPQLTDDGLLDKLTDKNWNVRNDALNQIIAIVVNAKHISPNIGDLPTILCKRFQDSNRNIAANSFLLCQNLAAALGPHCKQHVRTLLSSIINGLGDSRTNVRYNAVDSLNAWADHAGLDEFFRGETVADALKTNSPLLRTELFIWLSIRLPEVRNVSKDDLGAALGLLFTSMEDRNAEVRKAAQACVLPFMIHLGYDTMAQASGQLKTASKTAVVTLLDKARANLPNKLPPKKAPRPCNVSAPETPSAETGNKNEETPSKPASASAVRASKLPVKKIARPPTRKSEEKEPNAKIKVSPIEISDDDEIDTHREEDTPGLDKTFTAEVNENYYPEEPMDSKPTSSIPEPNNFISVPPQPLNQQIQSNLPLPPNLRFDSKELDFGGEELKPLPDLYLYPVEADFLTNELSILPPSRRTQTRSQTRDARSKSPAKCGQRIDMLISLISSVDFVQSTAALVRLESVVSDSDNSIARVLYPKMEVLICAIHKQIARLLSTLSSPQKTVHEILSKNFHAISNVLNAIYSPYMELGKNVSSRCLKQLIYNSLKIIADPHMSFLPDQENIVKHFNILAAKAIEKSDANAAICAVMGLLTDTVNADDDTSIRILELTMKCQWKTLKHLGVWLAEPGYEFDIQAFIMEFHTFIQANPIESFTSRDPTPLKTIRTILYTLIIKLGPRKFDTALSNMEIVTSEAGLYLKKIIDRELQKQGECAEPNYRTSADDSFKTLPNLRETALEAHRAETYEARLLEIKKRVNKNN